MRSLLIFFLLSSISYADQGLKISCLNMLNSLGAKYDVENFTLDTIHFQFLERETKNFIKIKTKELNIGEDFFTVRLDNYEITFQKILFNGEKKKRLVMSKYDYKENKFLDHYTCDYNLANIQ